LHLHVTRRPSAHSIVLLAIVMLAGLVRLNRSGDLSLWLDEGLTVGESRFPWDGVVGLLGPYDEHPPLYFALTKLMSILVPEVYAGRLVSVIAGTLTVPVVYALGRRLLDRKAGLVAAVIVAFAPLLVWYSQEARMYASTAFFVSLAYLAFFAAIHTGMRRWALVYALSLWLAMEFDYSALFALLPHGLLIAIALYRDKRRGALVLLGALAAFVAYVPWMLHLPGTLPGPTDRASFLGFGWEKVFTVIVSTTGLDAGSYAPTQTGFSTAWSEHPILHRPLLLLVAAVGVIGTVVLARRSVMAAITAVGLTVGTVAFAAIASILLTPSFTDRTVLYATVGWALLCAATVGPVLSYLTTAERPADVSREPSADRRAPRGWIRYGALAAGIAVVMQFAAGLVTLHAIETYGDKQHWRELVQDVAQVARPESPVLGYPRNVMDTFIDLYAPGAVVGQPFYLDGGHPVTAQILTTAGDPKTVWYAFLDFTDYIARSRELEGLGYRLVSKRIYFWALTLEEYALLGR
jgi:hypothetical protein